jgi:hypothetical protein
MFLDPAPWVSLVPRSTHGYWRCHAFGMKDIEGSSE